MKHKLFVYLLVIAAAVFAIAGLIHLGGTWLSPQGAQAVGAAGPLLSRSLNWGRSRTLAPAGPLARSS